MKKLVLVFSAMFMISAQAQASCKSQYNLEIEACNGIHSSKIEAAVEAVKNCKEEEDCASKHGKEKLGCILTCENLDNEAREAFSDCKMEALDKSVACKAKNNQ